MSNFKEFQQAVEKRISFLGTLRNAVWLRAEVSRDDLWDTYINSFPEGSNPIHKERTVHDCNCCKNFIRDIGGLIVVAENGDMYNIWEGLELEQECFATVAGAMECLISTAPIRGLYFHESAKVGREFNYDDEGTRYEHFFATIPDRHVMRRCDIPSKLSAEGGRFAVFKRTLEEITLDTIDTVLELINENQLYRGKEHERSLKDLRAVKEDYTACENTDAFLWLNYKKPMALRNSVIGSLLCDLESGMELEQAVASFETKVAPENYKRTKVLVTEKMVEKAVEKTEELGIGESLLRRHAQSTDLTINNVLFADNSLKKDLGVFDVITTKASHKPVDESKVTQVPMATFLSDILPTASSVDVWLESRMENNLFSLVAPVNPDAPNILKWDNNFTWTYNGDITDSSVKERVKKAGGKVDGHLRVSLGWANSDDLDLSLHRKGTNNVLYFSHRNLWGATLDVDMNAGGATNKVDPVENITWPSKGSLQAGEYTIMVHNYSRRSMPDSGYSVEVEYDGQTTVIERPQLKDERKEKLFTFTIRNNEVVDLKPLFSSTESTKDIWGIQTNNWIKATTVCLSPNHWDDNAQGNKHYFFTLENCVNPESARGLYNEFLSQDLYEHRKVFEHLGGKLKAPHSTDQMSGVGFSETKPTTVKVRVDGRVYEVSI